MLLITVTNSSGIYLYKYRNLQELDSEAYLIELNQRQMRLQQLELELRQLT